MKVYLDCDGERRLVGRADIPAGVGPVVEVAPPHAPGARVERFALGTVTHLPAGGGVPAVERAVILSPGQRPELLPGWRPLAS